MGETAAPALPGRTAPAFSPRFSGFSHLSLPCRDLEESKRFFTAVMGGELIHDVQGFFEVRVADVIIGLSEQSGGWTARDAEYPHYAFYTEGRDYWPMKEWLENHGVPTHHWTRDHETALLYFRDPSGNLFEIYCDRGYEGVRALPLGPRQGGPSIDFGGLNYRWTGAGARKDERGPRFSGFAHASLPVRDLNQSKRFFTRVMGGELIHDVQGFFEVRVGGVVVGLSDRSGQSTGRAAEYPHYAFFVEAEDFLSTRDWLRGNGVKTTEAWTRDGVKGLMYFRDPSGNLFETYCRKVKDSAAFVRGAKQGGSYEIDLGALNYEWNG